MGKTLSKDRTTVTVSSMPGIVWDTIGDRDIKREASKMRRGAGLPQESEYSKNEHDDLTLETFWDPTTHPTLFKDLRSRPEKFNNSSITTQELDPSDVPIPGTADTLTGCGVISAKKDGSDANNGKDKVKLTVTFSVPL